MAINPIGSSPLGALVSSPLGVRGTPNAYWIGERGLRTFNPNTGQSSQKQDWYGARAVFRENALWYVPYSGVIWKVLTSNPTATPYAIPYSQIRYLAGFDDTGKIWALAQDTHTFSLVQFGEDGVLLSDIALGGTPYKSFHRPTAGAGAVWLDTNEWDGVGTASYSLLRVGYGGGVTTVHTETRSVTADAGISWRPPLIAEGNVWQVANIWEGTLPPTYIEPYYAAHIIKHVPGGATTVVSLADGEEVYGLVHFGGFIWYYVRDRYGNGSGERIVKMDEGTMVVDTEYPLVMGVTEGSRLILHDGKWLWGVKRINDYPITEALVKIDPTTGEVITEWWEPEGITWMLKP